MAYPVCTLAVIPVVFGAVGATLWVIGTFLTVAQLNKADVAPSMGYRGCERTYVCTGLGPYRGRIVDAATVGILVAGGLGLAGILATFFAPTWAQRRIEQRREKREFRSAQRLVAANIATLNAYMQAACDSAEKSSVTALTVLTVIRSVADVGEEHRQVLSTSLPDEVWKAVADTYRRLASICATLEASGPGPLLPEQLEMLKNDVAHSARAKVLLDKATPLID